MTDIFRGFLSLSRQIMIRVLLNVVYIFTPFSLRSLEENKKHLRVRPDCVVPKVYRTLHLRGLSGRSVTLTDSVHLVSIIIHEPLLLVPDLSFWRDVST
jgi:hypothetical protein